jgi:ubiquinone/menaquinone biosynthesis C-methylase UbiE
MFEQFRHRSSELERLDTGDYTPAEYARWQLEMRFIHRIFGEVRALKATLFREMNENGHERVSVLDVGAGSGELLRELVKWTDGRKTFFAGAEIHSDAARSIHEKDISAIQCDALQLPLADDSFDHAFCTLFLHHLDDAAAIELVREMARVSRGRIFVIDLNRHPTAYYTYKIVGRLFLQRFSLEDGALSILRSRTPLEMRAIAVKAGLCDVRVEHSRVNRLILSGIGADDD